ncbi:MAG: hypothetical protein ACXVAX_02775 [Pseudobdellovibrio sp.]
MFSKRLFFTVANSLLILSVLTGLIACSSKDEMKAARDSIVKKDLSDVPSKIQVSQASALDLDSLKKAMYAQGCLVAGQPLAKLGLHPNLVASTTYMIEQSKTQGANEFKLQYSLSLDELPAVSQTIVLNGQIQDSKLTGFVGALTAKNDLSVTKKCSILNESTAYEVCTNVQPNYTDNFLTQYNTLLQDSNCKIDDSPIKEKDVTAPTEDWVTGTYTLSDNSQINIFIHREQSLHYRRCGTKPLDKVVQTTLTATSNDIPSYRYSHCGGETVYKKVTTRSDQTGELISNSTSSILFAPKIPPPPPKTADAKPADPAK